MVIEKATSDFKLLKHESESPAELLVGLIKMKKEGVNEISKEFLSDFYSDKELGLKEYMEMKSKEVWIEILKDFKGLQEKGLIRKNLNIEFFLYFANRVNDLIEDPYLLSLFPNPEDLVMELTNLFAFGMTPIETKL
jgi:hypothetical protein